MLQLPVNMAEMKESNNTFFIELYIIELRNRILRIAACDENITYNGNVYYAAPVQRQTITKSMDNIIDGCQFTLGDCDEELLAYILDGFDFRGCTAIVFRIMYPDSLTDPSIYQWLFSGIVDEPSYSNGTFSCKLQSRMPTIECPNRTYQLACNSEFGDESCTMSKKTQNVSIIGTEAGGNVLVINKSFSTNYWKDGTVTVLGETRNIVDSDGNKLTINVNFLQEGLGSQPAEIRRGCDKSVSRCKYYNNLIHYGGFPAIPFESVYR